MSKKKKQTAPGAKAGPVKEVVHIKYVSKANRWCRTTIVGNVQKQEWLDAKPTV